MGTLSINTCIDPITINLDFKVKQVALREDASLLLTEDGKVYACGTEEVKNSPFFVEVYDFSDKKIVNLVSGAKHSFATDTEGNIFGWGSYKFGELGI